MKIYTRTGDEGMTGLFGGQRVSKDCLRVETYGTVDELNSHIGLVLAGSDIQRFPLIHKLLPQVQSRLFDLGADLATPHAADTDKAILAQVHRFPDDQVAAMEAHLDEVWALLEPMKNFILPGGSELAARLHIARTVCRRAERLCVALRAQEPVSESVLVYLNRLSDLLFALARYANHVAGVADVPWVSGKARRQRD